MQDFDQAFRLYSRVLNLGKIFMKGTQEIDMNGKY